MLDAFLFGVLPYLAVTVAVGGTLLRRRALRDTLGARSTQLLEGRADRAFEVRSVELVLGTANEPG